MKIHKILSVVLAVFIIVAAFSGCSLNFFSVESLLSPPSQSGENGEIQDAFYDAVGDKAVQLKAPATGEYLSPFVCADVDGDGIDEVLVFYSETGSEGTVRVLLMKEYDGKWAYCTDIKGAGNGIYDVNFFDINNDKIPEIFVSWTLMDSQTTRIVTVFKVQADKDGELTLVSLGNEYGIAKSFVDFDTDGKTDLCLIYIDDTEGVQKSYLRLFTLSDSDVLVKYGEILLDSSIRSISGIKHDVIKNGKNSWARIFVDCVKNERLVFTEMVYWDASQKKPVRAFSDAAISNSRNSLVACEDVDGDGLIEIPVITTLYGASDSFSVVDSNGTHVFTMLKWCDVTGDSGESSVRTLLNPIDGYLFDFKWGDKVTVKYDILREALVFYEWDNDEQIIGEEIFSLMYRENNDANEIPGELLRNEDFGEYYYRITEDGESFGITKSMLESAVTTIV